MNQTSVLMLETRVPVHPAEVESKLAVVLTHRDESVVLSRDDFHVKRSIRRANISHLIHHSLAKRNFIQQDLANYIFKWKLVLVQTQP